MAAPVFPTHEILFVSDDAKARALLDSIKNGGTAELLSEAAKHAELALTGTAREYKHPTHWVFGFYYQPSAFDDHGVGVIAVPKQLSSRAAVVASVKQVMGVS